MYNSQSTIDENHVTSGTEFACRILKPLNNIDMKRNLLIFCNTLLASLLAVLGFAADRELGMMCKYGVPNNQLSVTGQVTDQEGKPLKGMGVKIIGRNSERNLKENIAYARENGYEFDSLQIADTTDAEGRFSVETNAFYLGDSLRMVVLDIDGDANGKYASDTVQLAQPEYRRDEHDSWTRNAEIDDVKMTMHRVTPKTYRVTADKKNMRLNAKRSTPIHVNERPR